jgi:hypothetical protein
LIEGAKMRNSELFATFIQQTEEVVGLLPHPEDRSIPLFHLLAGALEWCDEHNVDFDLTLEEVRDSFRENQ